MTAKNQPDQKPLGEELRKAILDLPRPDRVSEKCIIEVELEDLEAFIADQVREAYKRGYIDAGIKALTDESSK